MATGIGSYSKTAASNSNASSEITLSDSMSPDAVDNTQRQIMADIAEWRDDTGGALATSGTDTYTVSTNGSISSLAAGARLCVRIGTTNTGAATLNPDSLGAKAIRKIVGGSDVAVGAGDLEAGRAYDLIYVTALNSSAGGWLVVGYGRALLGRGNVIVPHENLKIVYATAATVTVTADALVLFDSDGNSRRFATWSVTPNMGSSGAGGLDTGSEGISTWYYIWAIAKADGTLSVIFSASSSAPTLPSGYIYKGLIGAVRNNGSSNFTAFVQRGTQISTIVDQVVTDGSQTSYTAVSLAGDIPPIATRVTGYGGIYTSSGTTAELLYIAPAGSGTTATYGNVIISKAAAISASSQIISWFDFPLSTAQEIKYYVAGTNPRANIVINGWGY